MREWDSIVKCIKNNKLNVDLDKIRSAFEFAEESHIGQYRKSGDDYIVHPAEVAKILIDMKMDTDTIVSGILHDIVEDTLITVADLKYDFGDNVSKIVDGVTKLKNLPSGTKDQAENIRKMILAMANDIRVVIIKLADRLHNMRTLKFMPPEKQQRIAKETLEIYAPLAHRLGIAKIKWELEDLCLYYLHNDKYNEIKNLIYKKKVERKEYIDSFIEKISDLLASEGIKGEVKGRFKHFYSIYKKMYEKNKEFDDIYDLLGIRIILKEKAECYYVLGLIHSKYTPIPGRFKDYIAVSKSNNYQSIHTTVVGPTGKFIEIQIRTEEMDKVAEEGVAAHWIYKENKKVSKNDHIYGWFREILEFQKDAENTEDFVKGVTGDLRKETVFACSPKGDIIELSIGATVLDFAFAIHSQIGYKCVGAKVDGRIVPLDCKIKNGDVIEIITNKNSKGPSKDWLDIVATHGAKSKIKKFIKDSTFDETVRTGKELLEKELDKMALTLKTLEADSLIKKHMEKNNMKSMEDLFYQMGEKRSKFDILINKLKNRIEKDKLPLEFTPDEFIKKNEIKKVKNTNDFGIVIDGLDNTLIKLAKCCTPLPGDDIGGYITKITGITIHRKQCKNFQNMISHSSTREISVRWDDSLLDTAANKYNFTFTVLLYDRENIVIEIIHAISNKKINITSINTHPLNRDGKTMYSLKLSIEIKNKEEYDNLINNILSIKGVVSVDR